MSNIRTANDSDFNELMNSYLNKDINKFRKLIDEGININCLNSNGKSFVSCMLGRDHDDMMDKFLQILLKNNISLKQIGVEKSLLSIVIERHDNTSCLKKLLENNININSFGVFRFSSGMSQWPDDPAIFHAIEKKDDSIIDLLIKHNVDLNVENHSGETPLHFLLKDNDYYDKTKSIALRFEKLLKNGADPNVLGENGDTILHNLTYNFYGYDMLEILFKYNHNININAKNKYGNTALRHAIAGKNYDAVKFLIRKGANLNVRCNGGFTAVMLAASIIDIENLKLILKQSPDLSIVNDNGDNILHLLARELEWDATKIYPIYFDQISKSHPELLNTKNFNGHTPTDLLKNK